MGDDPEITVTVSGEDEADENSASSDTVTEIVNDRVDETKEEVKEVEEKLDEHIEEVEEQLKEHERVDAWQETRVATLEEAVALLTGMMETVSMKMDTLLSTQQQLEPEQEPEIQMEEIQTENPSSEGEVDRQEAEEKPEHQEKPKRRRWI